MTAWKTRLNISTCDALVARGELHFVENVSDYSVSIRPMAKQAADAISMTHAELADLIDKEIFTIEHGYFESRQVARRALAGRSLMSQLPERGREDAFWKECWVEAFLEAEARGTINRSEASVLRFLPELEAIVTERLKTRLRAAGRGVVFDEISLRRAPCRGSLMRWVRRWERTRDPMALVKKSLFNGGNARSLSAEVEVIIQRALEAYLHPNRLFPIQIWQAVNAEIREKNRIRALAGEAVLPEVSESTIRRRIKALDAFEVSAARHGVAVAKNKFGPTGGGLPVAAPLQRIEMDEWEIDLHAILADSGVDFTAPGVRDIKTGRYWLCVAVDTATRSFLGFKLSNAQSTEAAKAVVWMALQNKTEIARRLGCETEWKQSGHIYHVAVDNGSAFVDSVFKAALKDLAIDYSVMPAGVPKLRKHVERVFRSLATMLMPYLTGRSFANPQERGDYPSEKYAVHTAESIIELLMRFVIDIYHNKQHRGLEYASPNAMWDKLVSEFGWSPPPSRHKLRHILGIPLMRVTGRHGVLFCGINYHSKRLADHFLRHGAQELDIRVDPEDLGHVSVCIDEDWVSLKAQTEGLDGLSFAMWERTIFELRQGNRNACALQQDVIDRAIARIKKIDEEQRAWRRLGPINLSKADIKRAERETFWGMSLGGDPEISMGSPDEQSQWAEGLLSDVIGGRDIPAEDIDRPASLSPQTPIEYWKFSDEN